MSSGGPKNIRRSCKQSAFLARIGRLSEHVALRHSPSEVRTRENLFQSRRNLRTKHLVMGEISSPCSDCDVKGSTVDFAISASLIQFILI